jgi:hypothetical protein
MPKLKWDPIGDRKYEIGVDHGVIYPQDATGAYQTGEAWPGLTSVNSSPSGADANKTYADNIEYLTLRGAEEYGGTIEHLWMPDAALPCDGIRVINGVMVPSQVRMPFGFCYRTLIGNDTQFDDYGYILHLVWGATMSPSEKQYATKSDTPEPLGLSNEFTCSPVTLTTVDPTTGKVLRPCAHLEINSTKVTKESLDILEDKLYGTDGTGSGQGTDPELPTPDWVLSNIVAKT